MNDHQTVITGENIVKVYGRGEEKTKVLDKVSVQIMKNEFTAIMGPSGSGKSTLLFALSGMDDITSGSVKFKDQELSAMKENDLADIRRTKMGFIFQQPTMMKNLNILDNILLPSTREGRKNKSDMKKRAAVLMKKTGVEGLEDRDITEVSGGQLQRAGICRALMNAPEILFADEPTGALNSQAADRIMNLLVEIHREGTAILLVTHDAKVASRADRVLFTKDGKIVSDLNLRGIKGNRIEKISEQMTEIGV